jgi:hypothetical protein
MKIRICTCGKQLDQCATVCPGCRKTFKVTSGFAKFFGGFILAIAVIGAIGAMVNPPAPTPVVSSPEQVANQKDEAAFQRPGAGAKQLQASMRNPDSFKFAQGDEAAKLIGHCGKPDKDFTKKEGGQPIRHVIYKKQNVELMYSRQDVPAWVLVGIFEVNTDDNMDTAEANTRLACAAGSIHTVLDGEK